MRRHTIGLRHNFRRRSRPVSGPTVPNRLALYLLGSKAGETRMLWTIFVLLLVLWLLGLVTSYTLGGFIHILLIVAIAVLCIQLISGRRAI
jgi:hypothetical protein